MKTLFIVDPQNDFIGKANGSPLHYFAETAALPVRGAYDDMLRLSQMIRKRRAEFSSIIVSLDTHEPIGVGPDIGHRSFWSDANGDAPEPFTRITLEDLEHGVWTPREPSHTARVHAYLARVGGQTIWPRHCIDGTWGHQVFNPLREVLNEWHTSTGMSLIYVRKGMNPFTEQYGVFEAAVPDVSDRSTLFNEGLLRRIESSDEVVVAGEALDFCVMTSVGQMVSRLPKEKHSSITLLTDCMSPVNLDGKNTVGETFLAQMRAFGIRTETTESFAAAA